MGRAPGDRARSGGRRAEPSAAGLAAAWTTLVLAGLPLAALGIVVYALDLFDISDPRLQGGVDALLDGLRIVAIANALGRGLLAPRLANWRLLPSGTAPPRSLFRFMRVAATIWLPNACSSRPRKRRVR